MKQVLDDIEEQHPTTSQQLVFGEIVHWVTIVASVLALLAAPLALARPAHNLLNPNRVLAAVWSGRTPAQIWTAAGAEFPGAHFYLRHPTLGDGVAQLTVVLGCSIVLLAMVPTVISYLRRRMYFYAGMCVATCLLVALPMLGCV